MCDPLLAGSRLTSSSRQYMAAEDSESVAAICERDMHSLHRNIPALRRTDVDTSAIRHHYYPDGGWGWVVCGTALTAHGLSAGLLLSWGAAAPHAVKHLHARTMDAGESTIRHTFSF